MTTSETMTETCPGCGQAMVEGRCPELAEYVAVSGRALKTFHEAKATEEHPVPLEERALPRCLWTDARILGLREIYERELTDETAAVLTAALDEMLLLRGELDTLNEALRSEAKKVTSLILALERALPRLPMDDPERRDGLNALLAAMGRPIIATEGALAIQLIIEGWIAYAEAHLAKVPPDAPLCAAHPGLWWEEVAPVIWRLAGKDDGLRARIIETKAKVLLSPVTEKLH